MGILRSNLSEQLLGTRCCCLSTPRMWGCR